MASVWQPPPKFVFINRIINRHLSRIMFWTFFLIGFSATSLFGWQRYYRKWHKSQHELTKLTIDLKVADHHAFTRDNTIGHLKEEVNGLKEEIMDYKHLVNSGWRNVKVMEQIVHVNGNDPIGLVAVVGQDTRRSDLYFTIKTLHYNVEDMSDREFAIREAEELIEKINE